MARGYSRLNRRSDNRKALMRDLATQFFLHGRIETTETKAKELRRVVEKLITLGKKGDLASRRLAAETLRFLQIDDKYAIQKLFDEVAPKYQDRNGGYTRIYKIGARRGDGVNMAIIELV